MVKDGQGTNVVSTCLNRCMHAQVICSQHCHFAKRMVVDYSRRWKKICFRVSVLPLWAQHCGLHRLPMGDGELLCQGLSSRSSTTQQTTAVSPSSQESSVFWIKLFMALDEVFGALEKARYMITSRTMKLRKARD